MNAKKMLFIDKYIGGALIRALSFAVAGSRETVEDTARPLRTIAVAKFLGMGSIVEAIPLLQYLKASHPQANIIFISFKQNESLLESIKPINGVFTIRTSNLAVFIWDTLKCVIYLRRQAPDAFLDLEFYSRYATLMAWASGAIRRVGFHSSSIGGRGLLLTRHLHLNNYRPIRDNYLRFAQALETPLSTDRILKIPAENDILPQTALPPKTAISISVSAPAELASFKAKNRVKAAYAVVSPTCDEAMRRLKQWPDAYWPRLVDILTRTMSLDIVATGESGEKEWIDRLFGKTVHNACGSLSFQGYLALLKDAALVIGLDSASAHIANLFETPVISLFGPETPVLYGALGPKVKNLYLSLTCSPCLNIIEGKSSACTDNVCLKWIKPEQVAAEALGLVPAFANPRTSHDAAELVESSLLSDPVRA